MIGRSLTKRLIAIGLTSTLAISGGYLVAPFEGEKKDTQGNNIAYLDIVGIPTICAGWTHGVKLGDKKSDTECEELLAKEIQDYNRNMKKHVKVELFPYEEIAYTSFVWNLGETNFKNSTLLKKLNSGDRQGACSELLKWNKAGGKTVKGLDARRKFEYEVCMGRNADVNAAISALKQP